MRRLLPPLVFLVLLAVFLGWWFSATQVVKRRTRDLMEVLTLDVGASSGARNVSRLKFDDLLASRVVFDMPSIEELNGSHDRSEIDQGFVYLCGAAKETRFRVKDLESVIVSGDKAAVTATLEVHADLKSARSRDETGRAVLHWLKTEEGWRLEGADWAPVKK